MPELTFQASGQTGFGSPAPTAQGSMGCAEICVAPEGDWETHMQLTKVEGPQRLYLGTFHLRASASHQEAFQGFSKHLL